MNNRSTVLRCALVGLSLVSVMVFVLFFFFLSGRTIDRVNGPDNWCIEFVETQRPVFFSPSAVQLIVYEGKEQRATINATIVHDGKTLTKSNWKVIWHPDSVTVHLMGEEQDTLEYKITLDRPVELLSDK